MRDTHDPEIQQAARLVSDNTGFEPEIALVLGSGLGSFAEEIPDPVIIPTGEIPGYPASTVPGHAGRLVSGRLDGVNVLIVQGRIHYYEGYPISSVVFPVRLAAALGSRALVVTNAAGGISDDLEPGDLMAITDHVNLMGVNPLIGQNWGFERFPDMSRAYDPELRAALHHAADHLEIALKDGVLGGWSGPSYETAAEVRLLRSVGVSAACMSTIPEVIAASRLHLRTVGISCITNKGTGLSDKALTHEEVTEVAGLAERSFRMLLRAAVQEIADSL